LDLLISIDCIAHHSDALSTITHWPYWPTTFQ